MQLAELAWHKIASLPPHTPVVGRPRRLSTDDAHPSRCQEICRGPLLSTKFLTGTPAASSIVT